MKGPNLILLSMLFDPLSQLGFVTFVFVGVFVDSGSIVSLCGWVELFCGCFGVSCMLAPCQSKVVISSFGLSGIWSSSRAFAISLVCLLIIVICFQRLINSFSLFKKIIIWDWCLINWRALQGTVEQIRGMESILVVFLLVGCLECPFLFCGLNLGMSCDYYGVL